MSILKALIVPIITAILSYFFGDRNSQKEEQKQMAKTVQEESVHVDQGWQKAQQTGDTSDLERID